MVDEINAILGQIGEDRLTWERSVAVGSDRNLDALLEQHGAVFVGAGLQAAAPLDDEARKSGQVRMQRLDLMALRTSV